MTYIYKIINDINNKIYIGKTERTVEERFKEHCRDASHSERKNRPLYKAMNKYGIEHFHVETIEQTDIPEEREKYWIEYYKSFKNGYNATMGGDGKKYLDYDLIISTYQEVQNIKKTASILEIHPDTISNILKVNNVPIKSSQEITKETKSKIVHMYSLENELLKTFPSTAEAARYLINNDLTHCKFTTIRYHISEVCNSKRRTAAGYRWSY